MEQPKRVTKNLSVMWTDQMYRDLTTIKEAGMDQSEATRWAFHIAANILRHAWMNGHEEHGKVPQMRVQYRGKGEKAA